MRVRATRRRNVWAIRGGSAGGLLMGAVTNLRPDLFRAVVAEVPFVDVVTTMQDTELPLTVTEWEEWGNPLDDADDYAYMKSYSPYDNVEARGVSRDPRHGRAQRSARSATGSPPSGSPSCGRSAPTTARWCSRPRWAPATAAPPGATTRGATRR